jgi:UDP-N-acetylmuramoylalanine--D-glutamate ligase
MRISELAQKTVAIWGTGLEGLAAARFLRRFNPGQSLVFIDESGDGDDGARALNAPVLHEPAAIGRALDEADAIVKSPGVSLYHPRIQAAIASGKPVTSLLNLWFAEKPASKTVLVTGTKGKSTTCSLIGHALDCLGYETVVAGNIGVPITDAYDTPADFVVVEVSSYQAAGFDGLCDLGVVVSLFPEHLDWHLSLEQYYRDKLNLLAHARAGIVSPAVGAVARTLGLDPRLASHLAAARVADTPAGFHAKDGAIWQGGTRIGAVDNPYLARAHNLSNVCIALAAIDELALDARTALQSFASFRGLPHRQTELGVRDGILFVDDSISTTPQSTIAALEAYRGHTVTLIAGGFDRGIDYSPLSEYLSKTTLAGLVCMGDSGARIAALARRGAAPIFEAATMQEAVRLARSVTPMGGVILLSPAAPSYGLFKNFIERGKAFAREMDRPAS